jgi:hypothetical protein
VSLSLLARARHHFAYSTLYYADLLTKSDLMSPVMVHACMGTTLEPIDEYAIYNHDTLSFTCNFIRLAREMKN